MTTRRGGGVEEGDDEPLVVLVRVARAAGEELGGGGAAGDGVGEHQRVADGFLGFDQAVGEDDGLELGDDGADDADDDFLVDQWRLEVGVDDVLDPV